MAMHSMVHKSTGHTPNELMLGRNVLQPLDLLMGTLTVEHFRRKSGDWFSRLSENLDRVHRFARENLKTAQLRQKRDYDLRVVENAYHVGDLVYRVDVSTKVGKKALQPVWLGPYVVEQCKPPLYWARGQRARGVYHHDKLKLCQDSQIPLWLRRLRNQVLATENNADLEPDLEDPVTSVAGLLEPGQSRWGEEEQDAPNLPEELNTDTETVSKITGNTKTRKTQKENTKELENVTEISTRPRSETTTLTEAITPTESDELPKVSTRTRIGRVPRIPAYLRDYDMS